MSVLMTLAANPESTEATADRVIDELLAGGVDLTVSRLLTTAAGGDPVLLRALVLTALALGELVRDDGRWRWNAPRRRTALSDEQLVALRALTEAWVKPYELVASEVQQRSVPEAAGVDLTQRQRQVLVLLSDGLTVQAIARRLSLSPRTVGKHLERMYRRLGTSDRLSTVLQAQRCGLLESVQAGQ